MPFQYGRVPSTYFPQPNPQFAMPGYGQPVPGNWNAAPGANQPPQMPVIASLATGTANPASAPRPKIRLQAPEMPRTQLAPLVLPTPEALGVRSYAPVPAAPPGLDWNSAHARLDRLGAVGFHLVRQPQGIQVTFMLPDGNQRAHQIEVVADTEAAAVHAALENAESWALARK